MSLFFAINHDYDHVGKEYDFFVMIAKMGCSGRTRIVPGVSDIGHIVSWYGGAVQFFDKMRNTFWKL